MQNYMHLFLLFSPFMIQQSNPKCEIQANAMKNLDLGWKLEDI